MACPEKGMPFFDRQMNRPILCTLSCKNNTYRPFYDDSKKIKASRIQKWIENGNSSWVELALKWMKLKCTLLKENAIFNIKHFQNWEIICLLFKRTFFKFLKIILKAHLGKNSSQNYKKPQTPVTPVELSQLESVQIKAWITYRWKS